jgi:hypothetical protein
VHRFGGLCKPPLHGGGRYSNPFLLRFGARMTVSLKTPDATPLDRWLPYIYLQPEIIVKKSNKNGPDGNAISCIITSDLIYFSIRYKGERFVHNLLVLSLNA